jgi:hypothetical protein
LAALILLVVSDVQLFAVDGAHVIDGVLPPAGTHCKQDLPPFPAAP